MPQLTNGAMESTAGDNCPGITANALRYLHFHFQIHRFITAIMPTMNCLWIILRSRLTFRHPQLSCVKVNYIVCHFR